MRRRLNSLRRYGYDYAAAGCYFVTICTWARAPIFGTVVRGHTSLSHAGEIARRRWFAIPDHHHGVIAGTFIVMPDHVHGIVSFPAVGATPASPLSNRSPLPDQVKHGPSPCTLGTVIGSYKSGVSRRINAWRGTPGWSIWQRGYYDRVVRDEAELQRIARYIETNPLRA